MNESSTIPVSRSRGELVNIQYLRAAAAAMVVIFHVEPQLRRMGYAGPWLPSLSGGVDVFFVISGFIMWVTTYGRPATSLQFWWRRITRIVPLYWVVTSVTVVMMLAVPRALQSSRFELHHVIASYLFVAAPRPVSGALEPVVVPGWTLNYEMLFYFIFGATLALPPRARFGATALALLLLAGSGLALKPSAVGVAGFYTSSIMIEFLFGMALGLLATRGDTLTRAPVWSGWVLLLGGLVVLLLLPILAKGMLARVVIRGIPSMAVVTGSLVLETHGRNRMMPWLHRLGDASYSIYLSHVIVLSAIGQCWRLLHFDRVPGAFLLFGIVAVTLSMLSGVVVYGLIERPILSLFKRRQDSAVARRLIEASIQTSP